MLFIYFFFFNDTATTEIYTLSLHDALPIFPYKGAGQVLQDLMGGQVQALVTSVPTALPHIKSGRLRALDRKSTRLNSSHANISYAVFCLKKKKKKIITS